ncbi:MAG TPA: hypothetical protein VFU29_10950 [Chitinophagaceae bacterium]|nr:hypothetical protein [Chitinophagaceae bacterium]
MHISLKGFVAGPNGEMNWIKIDEEIFDHSVSGYRFAFISRKDAKEQSRKGFTWRLAFNLCDFA